MTREEEIDNAKTTFYKRVLEDDYYYDPRDCFEEGAKWADEHSKSPWISIEDDLPCNHEELICGAGIIEGTETIEVFAINTSDNIWIDYMIYENGKWRWNDFEPSYWMIAPKLPKE